MKIPTIKSGQQVTEPGAYYIDMEWYHSQEICPGPSISSTNIRAAETKSPRAFWKTWSGNPERYPDKGESDSLILGKAAHALILGDEVFDETFVYVPKDAPPRPTAAQVAAKERDGKWSASAADRAAFWEPFDEKAAGRLMLKQEQVERIMYMAENIAASPEAVEILTSHFIEVSMIWQDEITGLWIKSRPDSLPTNGADFGDLKTFAPKIPNLMLAAQRAVTDHAYHMQMALAIMGSEHTLGYSAERAALVFVQTSEPYEVIPVELDKDALYWGRMQCRRGIDKIAHGLKTGEWPGAATGIMTYTLPPSMEEDLRQMQIEGTLPNG